MRQQYDRAVEVLGDAVALNPRTDGAIHYAYGSALAKARRRQEAHVQFKVAIEQGLKGLPKWVARWQLIWLGTVGRTVIIMLGLALVAAWLIWGQPDMSTLTLFGAFCRILVAQGVFLAKNEPNNSCHCSAIMLYCSRKGFDGDRKQPERSESSPSRCKVNTRNLLDITLEPASQRLLAR